jgi:GH24 family phage-related lysozyme (muramidase)
MRESVRAAFKAFSVRFEGEVPFMYLDIKGLVTIGVGNLIDSVAQAQQLPFFFKDEPGRRASPGEIAEDWQRVKGRQDLRSQGGMVFRNVAQLRISQETINQLVVRTASSYEATLKASTPEFAKFDYWPADAQLGLLSMAWAMGPGFATGGRWPLFRAACKSQDWDQAARQSRMNDTNNPGLRPRNTANFILFTNAARVADGSTSDASGETLYYPTVLTPGVGG